MSQKDRKKIDAALSLLRSLVNRGVEFPEALFRACRQLTPKQAEQVKALYDAA